MGFDNVNVNVSGPVQPTSTYMTKVLKGNHSFASQVTEPNMKYVIKHNFDLGGESVTIPKNCAFEFDGGSLSNGTIVGADTYIVNNSNSYVLDCELDGTFSNKEFIAEWFASSDNDDAIGINNAIQAAYKTQVFSVCLTKSKYYTSSSIILFGKCKLEGRHGLIKSQGSKINSNCTQVLVKEPVHGINIRSYDETDVDCNRTVIKNLYIRYIPDGENVEPTNSIKNNHGIYISNKTIEESLGIQFGHSKIENVAVENFKYGIYFDGCGFYGFNTNKFERCYTWYNEIGLVLYSTAGLDGRYSWTTNNLFEMCNFYYNRVGGVFYNSVINSANNLFLHCTFQNNGRGYNHSQLETNDYIGGYAFRAERNSTSSGTVIFDGCWFEANIFRRTSDEVYDDEYVYDGRVHPIGYNGTYLFQTNRQDLCVINSKFNVFANIANAKDAFLTFKNNFFQDSFIAYNTIENMLPYLYNINFRDNTWHSGIILDGMPNPHRTTAILPYSFITHVVHLQNLGLFYGRNKPKILINHGFYKNKIEMFYPDGNSFDLFLDSENGREVLDNICIEGQAGKNTSQIDYALDNDALMTETINVWFANNKSQSYTLYNKSNILENFKIYKQSLCFKPYNDIDEGHPKPILLGRSSSTIPKYIPSDLYVTNFKIQATSRNSGIFYIANGNAVIFTGCDFYINPNTPILQTIPDNVNIVFDSCTFKATKNINPNPTVIIPTTNGNNNVQYINCTVDTTDSDGVEVGTTLSSFVKRGLTSERPLLSDAISYYQYYDTTLSKPVYWNGTYWVDAVGTRITWPIGFTFTNVTASNTTQPSVNESYTTVLSATTGYSLPTSIAVKMGSTTLTAGTDYTYNHSTGEVVVLGIGGTGGVTGNLRITATGVANS